MTETVTIPAGSIVGNCPACGFVVDDDVDDDQCGTGFDCGQCGTYTANEPMELDAPLSVERDELADPTSVERGEAAA